MLADRRDGSSQSELERVFVRKLKHARLPIPIRQLPVGDRFVDISYPDRRVVIELDGAGSRFTARALRDDRRRQNTIVLALRGWTLLRFTWDDVVTRWPDVEGQLREVLG
jgi:very-short-patch-repair endonuclease